MAAILLDPFQQFSTIANQWAQDYPLASEEHISKVASLAMKWFQLGDTLGFGYSFYPKNAKKGNVLGTTRDEPDGRKLLSYFCEIVPYQSQSLPRCLDILAHPRTYVMEKSPSRLLVNQLICSDKTLLLYLTQQGVSDSLFASMNSKEKANLLLLYQSLKEKDPLRELRPIEQKKARRHGEKPLYFPQARDAAAATSIFPIAVALRGNLEQLVEVVILHTTTTYPSVSGTFGALATALFAWGAYLDFPFEEWLQLFSTLIEPDGVVEKRLREILEIPDKEIFEQELQEERARWDGPFLENMESLYGETIIAGQPISSNPPLNRWYGDFLQRMERFYTRKVGLTSSQARQGHLPLAEREMRAVSYESTREIKLGSTAFATAMISFDFLLEILQILLFGSDILKRKPSEIRQAILQRITRGGQDPLDYILAEDVPLYRFIEVTCTFGGQSDAIAAIVGYLLGSILQEERFIKPYTSYLEDLDRTFCHSQEESAHSPLKPSEQKGGANKKRGFFRRFSFSS